MKVRLLVMQLALVGVSSAHAASSCWVQQVRKDGDGAKISFSMKASLVIMVGQSYYFWDAGRLQSSGSEAPMAEDDGLRMKAGEVATLRSGFHSNCTLQVQKQDGKLVVKINSTESSPGLEPRAVEEVILVDD